VPHAQHIRLDPPEDPFGIRTFGISSRSHSSSDAEAMPDNVEGSPAEPWASFSDTFGDTTAADGAQTMCDGDLFLGGDAAEQRPALFLQVVLCALVAALMGVGMDMYLAYFNFLPARSVLSVYEQHRVQWLLQLDMQPATFELPLHVTPPCCGGVLFAKSALRAALKLPMICQ
jgi:hypothetical protein